MARLILLALLATTVLPCSSSEGQDKTGTYPDHHDLLYHLDAQNKKLPVKSPADWEHRKKHILAAMQEVMGPLPGKEQRVPLDVKQIEEVRVGKLVRRKITFQSDKVGRVPAYLFLPDGDGKKVPAILCLQQTTKIGSREPAGLGGNPDLHYALHLAERGYVTLAPDYPSFGDYAFDFDAKHGYSSGTMKAIWDNIRAVDYLQSLKEVDGERIGVIGHSLGGHNAMFTAALEPRLKVIVSSCGFCSFLKDDMPSWNGQRYMPRIKTVYQDDAKLMPFDFTEIVGVFAPRPFLACAAIKDNDFAVYGVKDCIKAAAPVYQLFGKVDRLQAYYPNVGHSFPADAQRKMAYEFGSTPEELTDEGVAPMVSQVPIIGILMIVNGALASLLGAFLAFMGPMVFSMLAMDGGPRGMRRQDENVLTFVSILYLVLGLLVLAAGVMNVIGGIRVLSYRGRTFAITALFFNILPVFTCYCSPTSLGLMIYGLIVMFQSDVAKAFLMGDQGVPAETIKRNFQPRPERYYEDDDDYEDRRDERRPLPPPKKQPPPGDDKDDRYYQK